MEQEVSVLTMGGVVFTVCCPLFGATYGLIMSRFKRLEERVDKAINGNAEIQERVARLETRAGE
jgi:hypothetical protein